MLEPPRWAELLSASHPSLASRIPGTRAGAGFAAGPSKTDESGFHYRLHRVVEWVFL
jgi:hypothetical protein